jgi:two-component system phosphate regulon response regulator PhoB
MLMPKVMLAEDDATMLSLLRTLLKMEGFDTTTLGVEEDVLEVLRRDAPDIVLLDVNLTQGNGIDFLRRIRRDEALKSMVVIMSSGMPLADECFDAGANSFLLKPYMPDTLINAIKDGLSNA